MQTNITEKYKNTATGQEADRILRNCVHCGFCTATCPTYQLLGDELDSPRGRIYLIKQVMEGKQVTSKTLQHLDRCLTCRSCETTCPSGVEYAHLLDIGRHQVEKKVRRPFYQQVQRLMLRKILTKPVIFKILTNLVRLVNPILPNYMRMHRNPARLKPFTAATKHSKTVLLLEGCVQPTLSPDINTASEYILDKAGYNVVTVKNVKCCGAISHHLNASNDAITTIKNNIDAWWPYIVDGCVAIVSNATGCGVTLNEYATYLKHDKQYAEKAAKTSALSKDISELLDNESIAHLKLGKNINIAFHAPCTLQHGLKLKDSLEQLLKNLGFELNEIPDQHLCCGSAGTYSILNPEISQQLRQNKLANLTRKDPEYILTANIGCLHHLQAGTTIPVKHWVEVIAQEIA